MDHGKGSNSMPVNQDSNQLEQNFQFQSQPESRILNCHLEKNSRKNRFEKSQRFVY